MKIEEITIEEAIKLIKEDIKTCNYAKSEANIYLMLYTGMLKEKNRQNFIKHEEAQIQLYEIAIEALMKDVPKKPFYEYDDEFICPNCGTVTEDYDIETIKRCPDCGQLLDWS